MTYQARIVATGSYVPHSILANTDLERMVNTSDEWIVKRTGIRERRIAAEDEFTSDLCMKAVENMTERYDVSVADVDMILVATYTPDFASPSVACLIQSRLGIAATGALDVNAACAGFVYALHLAGGLIAAGLHRKVLVIGADTASKIVDYTDRTTCILFGDGAGAFLLERGEGEGGMPAHHFGSDGSGAMHLYRTGLSGGPAGGPPEGDGLLRQNGREVYRFAVGTVPAGVRRLLAGSGWDAGQVDWFVPHSANLRIVEAICERTGIPLDRTLYSMEYYGNTSAATIPLSIDLGVQAGVVKPGDRMLLYGFGSGFAFGGLTLEWSRMKARNGPNPASAGRCAHEGAELNPASAGRIAHEGALRR